ncbi:hypothetical protein HX878_20510 [Pseudomonas veronii]|uniref:hypothetical protein n=1 Tax=Pseudomonas veronii TaxID=76761 RepID=UPI0015A0A72E|nr:hypothetical protein [Pseudomonas veronii]NWD57116.1 hypothetical protein [Pseudomonas veronii]
MTGHQLSEREAELFQAFAIGAKSSQDENSGDLERSFRERYADDPEILESFEDGQGSVHSERVYMGLIKNHGQARYQHDPKESMSYFVTLTTPAGDVDVWGKDLQRALAERNLKVGDPIRLDYKGSEPVSVQVKKKDDQGNVIGHETIATHRNAWKAQKWPVAIQSAPTDKATAGVGGRAHQPISDGGPVQQVGRPQMSVAQSFMLGAKGLGGLRSMLSSGGGAVNNAVGGFRAERPEIEFRKVLEEAEQHVKTLVAAGIGTTDPAMSPDQAIARNHDILRLMENKETFDRLSSALDRAVLLSRGLIEKGAGAGADDSTLVERGVDPLKQFLKQHESVLKAIPTGDHNLYDRLQKGLDRLVAMIASMFERLVNVNDKSAGKADRDGPKLGA